MQMTRSLKHEHENLQQKSVFVAYYQKTTAKF